MKTQPPFGRFPYRSFGLVIGFAHCVCMIVCMAVCLFVGCYICSFVRGSVRLAVRSISLSGVWITEDAGDWSVNFSEICKKAYVRISVITKLKYGGVYKEDLIDIYFIFIRSRVEYCSAAFRSSLTFEQESKLIYIKKTCFRIILQ